MAVGGAPSGAMVEVRSPERALGAYLSPAAGDKDLPGLVVVHEIFGLSPWIREVADRFAARGYLALAPDLFSGWVHPRFTPQAAERLLPLVWDLPVEKRIVSDALRGALKGHRQDDVEIAVRLAQLSQGIEWMPPLLDDLRACVGYLRGLDACSGRVGAIGFCFGGKMAFHLATVEPTLDAAVVYYGSGPREAEVERIACPVLGIYGNDDENVTKDVPRVAAAMRKFNKAFELEIYDRTGHAFARPGSRHYRSDRAEEAWKRTDAFLDRALRPA